MKFLILAMIVFAGAHPAHAEDIVLQIAFNDNIAITHTNALLNARTLRKLNPNARVITLETSTARIFGPRNPKFRAEMIAKLSALQFGPDDRIRTLLIATHGGSTPQQSSLGYIGKITAAGGDESFNEFFAPIKERIADDARVIINSCNNFKGTVEQVTPRVEAMMASLNARNGSLYGPSSLHSIPGLIVGRKLVLSAALFVLAESYLNQAHAGFEHPIFWSRLYVHASSLGIQMAAVIGGLELLGSARVLNVGRLYQLRDGAVIGANPVSVKLDRQLVFQGPRCASELVRETIDETIDEN